MTHSALDDETISGSDGPGSHGDDADHAFNVLLTLLIHALMPMFMRSGASDVRHARIAAIETVNAYRVRTSLDLFGIVQIIGFGLGALGSLSLSMTDGLPLPMVLRLRVNSCSLNRAAEQNRRALERYQRTAAIEAEGAVGMDEHDAAYEAEAIESVRQTQLMLAQARAGVARPAVAPIVATAAPEPAVANPVAADLVAADLVRAPAVAVATCPVPSARPLAAAAAAQPEPIVMPVAVDPAPVTLASVGPAAGGSGSGGSGSARPAARNTAPASSAAASAAPPVDTNQAYRAMFATAMHDVAAEYTADLANLPPLQRKEASIRAQALSTSATALLSGAPLPPFQFSLRNAATAPQAGALSKAAKDDRKQSRMPGSGED